jgi:stage V sporulation protein D (sporulation-specific penicillin-binding protein)
MSTVANGGSLVKPRLVSRIIDSKGETIKEFRPVTVRKVISVETSGKLKEMLEGVVERGTGKKARLKGYSSAGKTGTAQKVEPTGVYSHSKFVASFIGFAPVDKPAITICVMIDEPRPAYFGGTVAAPVFSEIAEGTLSYLGIESSWREQNLVKSRKDKEAA